MWVRVGGFANNTLYHTQMSDMCIVKSIHFLTDWLLNGSSSPAALPILWLYVLFRFCSVLFVCLFVALHLFSLEVT
jgi:hypothetical protein